MEQKLSKPSFWGNIKALFLGIFISLLLVEILLRIFQPFPFRVKNGKIILPANQKNVWKNNYSTKLEPVIYYSRNSLGLRGEELPKQPEQWTKIITIGGSTTECSYNSDSLTWPELLKNRLRQNSTKKIWVNNAGLDGTSTMGHIILLKDHVVSLQPDYVLFLIGINDTEKDDEHNFDLYHSSMMNWGSPKEIVKSLLKKTEIGALVENIYRYKLAYNKGLVHRVMDFEKQKKLVMPDSAMQRILASQPPYLNAYAKRIITLDSICRANNIRAIFLTQPSLFGRFTDPATGLDFTNLEVSPDRSSELEYKVLEMYNDVLRDMKAKGRITTIDIADAMPKNSTLYYDFSHYTSVGTDTLSRLLNDSLQKYIN